MIFKHGFVHCDAHPGNIMIRKKPKRNPNQPNDYQIVLLDHGLYRVLEKQFVSNYSKFWISLIKFDKKNIEKDARKLNIDKHF